MWKKKFLEKSKDLNWIEILLVIVLSYGFIFTNQSIGIDDENFDFYFKNNGLIASGRWGFWLIKKVFDTYSYLPVWRETIALTLLVVAAIVFVCLYEKMSGKILGRTISTLAVCMIISYPIIAKMFIYIDNCVETSLCILLALLAFAAYISPFPKCKWLHYVTTIAFLIVGCALIENTLVYFSIEICFFSLISSQKNHLRNIWIPVGLCAAAAVITKWIASAVASYTGIGYMDYGTNSYFKWNQITDLHSLYVNICQIYSNFTYWVETYFSAKVFFFAGIFWIAVSLCFLFLKKWDKAVLGIGILVSSAAMYLITGNGTLPLRIFTSYYIAVVGGFVYVSEHILGCIDRIFLKNACKSLCILCACFYLFYATKESNAYYQLDYKRYLRDCDVARTVNYDLEKMVGVVPDVPVVFLGQPEQYGDINPESEFALTTIYSNNLKGESIRIHRFFSMLGYEYQDVLGGGNLTIYNYNARIEHELVKEAMDLSADMQVYPYDGYIQILDHMIIVKLGNIEQ